ncbi:MAG: hypothetical protein M3N57_09535 [Actinomycetota bacterium]|nr:hypothetical protein [Actinomycetota bacterium]
MPPEHPLKLSRRGLLRGLGGLGIAGLLAACGEGRPAGTASPAPTGTAEDVRRAVLAQVGIDAPLDLSVILPAGFFLTGPGRRVVFGLGTSPTEVVGNLDVEAYLVSDLGLEVAEGPLQASFHDEGLEGRGIYVITTSVQEPGTYWLAAASSEHAAVGALNIFDAARSPLPEIGSAFPSAPTPTVDDPMGMEELCTREPDCSMHDVSLEAALTDGRPVVMTVATPKYCKTAICGPVVDIVEDLKGSSGRDDVAWIHVEVFSDAGNTPIPLVAQDGPLPLPSEPWTFFVTSNGNLADRYEGPTPADLLRTSLEQI